MIIFNMKRMMRYRNKKNCIKCKEQKNETCLCASCVRNIERILTKLAPNSHTHTLTRLHTNKTHIQSRYKNHYVNHPQIWQNIQSTSYRSIRTLIHKLSPAIYKHILMHAHAGNASIRTAFSSLFLICWETRKKK